MCALISLGGIRICPSLKALERLPLCLFAQERDDIVFKKNPCTTDPSTNDVTLLREFHRRGAVDFQEVGAFL